MDFDIKQAQVERWRVLLLDTGRDQPPQILIDADEFIRDFERTCRTEQLRMGAEDGSSNLPLALAYRRLSERKRRTGRRDCGRASAKEGRRQGDTDCILPLLPQPAGVVDLDRRVRVQLGLLEAATRTFDLQPRSGKILIPSEDSSDEIGRGEAGTRGEERIIRQSGRGRA